MNVYGISDITNKIPRDGKSGQLTNKSHICIVLNMNGKLSISCGCQNGDTFNFKMNKKAYEYYKWILNIMLDTSSFSIGVVEPLAICVTQFDNTANFTKLHSIKCPDGNISGVQCRL